MPGTATPSTMQLHRLPVRQAVTPRAAAPCAARLRSCPAAVQQTGISSALPDYSCFCSWCRVCVCQGTKHKPAWPGLAAVGPSASARGMHMVAAAAVEGAPLNLG